MATSREGDTNSPADFIPNAEAVTKMRLQGVLSDARNDPVMRSMVSLLNLLIDDVRKQNDRAPIRAIMRNQGKIAAFQDLIDVITRDYPGMQKFS